MNHMNKIEQDNLGIPLAGVRRKAINELNELIYNDTIKLKVVEVCFCGGESFTLLTRFDRYGLPFGSKICENCGLILQTLSIEKSSLKIFYDRIYWPLNTNSTDPSLFNTISSSISELLEFLMPEVKINSKNLILYEIGCGNGNRLKQIKDAFSDQYNVEAIGCDYSKLALQEARKLGLTVRNGGLETFESEKAADVLILSHVFEHFSDLNEALDSIENITHENSIVYIEVPGVIDLENKKEYSYSYQIYSVVAHIHNFSLSTLTNVFGARGFRLIKGTEYIRAVMSKNIKSHQLISNDPYNEIMLSLKRAQDKYLKFRMKSDNTFLRYIKRVAKALLNYGTTQ